MHRGGFMNRCASYRETSERFRGGDALLFIGGALVLGVFSAVLFLLNLGASSISGASDEVIYVRMVQGILHDDHIFPLYHGNTLAFEKPPLKLWLSAVFPWLLGESNLSFRLMDGLLGLTAVLLTVLLAYKLFASGIGALCAGFLVLAAPEWLLFHHSFRRAVLDSLLTVLSLGIALAAWSLISRLSRREPLNAPLWMLSLLGSLAVLTKSVGGLVPVACAVCALCTVESARRRYRELWPLVLPALILALYVGLLALIGGYSAVRVFVGVEILDRVMNGFDGHNIGDPWFYLRYVFHRGGLAPVYILVLGLGSSLIAARSNPQFRFLLPWVVLPIVLYSVSSSRVPWYLSPFASYASIIAIFGARWAVEQAWSNLVQMCLGVVVVILAIPAYSRALDRALVHISRSTTRLDIDVVVEQLKRSHERFVVCGNALSGRSQPIRGRFNVEGIYREMLKPHLTVVKKHEELSQGGRYVVFAREGDVQCLPPDGVILRRLQPNGTRSHVVAVIEYNRVVQ